jgi:hypothetical protein
MCPTTNLQSIIECLVTDFFMKGLFPLMIGLGLVMFLWGVFRFVRDSGDESSRTSGKKFMVWGLVGLFVMLCVWAFVEILAGTFSGRDIFIPQLRV